MTSAAQPGRQSRMLSEISARTRTKSPLVMPSPCWPDWQRKIRRLISPNGSVHAPRTKLGSFAGNGLQNQQDYTQESNHFSENSKPNLSFKNVLTASRTASRNAILSIGRVC